MSELACGDATEPTQQCRHDGAMRTIRQATVFLLVSQVALLIVEWMNRVEGTLLWWPSDDMPRFLHDLLLWPVLDPLHWAINLGIITMVLWLLAALTGRPRLTIALCLELYLALGIATYIKVQHLGMPVSLGDLSFVGFALKFMLKSWGLPSWLVYLPLIGLVGLAVWAWRRRKPATLGLRKRIFWASGAALLAVLLLIALHTGLRSAIAYESDDDKNDTHLSHYQEMGTNLALAMELIPGPADPATGQLSEQELTRIAANGPQATTIPSSSPHVIFWLSESFWDPKNLPNVQITPDPLANYRELAGEGRGYELLVPTFGGYTSRTMFEMVTGFSNEFVPSGKDAFTHIIHKAPFPSLARLFASRGYETVAIRAGMGDLFAGRSAYDMLGFSQYDTENDIPHAERLRGYITDQCLSEYVVHRVELSTTPMFVFLASIQNHAPFDGKDYNEYHLHIQDPTLRIVDPPMISYLEGLYQADQALGYLTARFEHDGVPVIIVFYGDHLAAFSKEYAAAGMFPPRDPMSLEQLRRKHTTAGLIWTNTSLRIPEMPKEVSPQAVITTTLRTMNIQHPFYTGMLGTLAEQCPAFAPDLVIRNDGGMQLDFPNSPEFRAYERLNKSLLDGYPAPKQLFPEGP